MNERKPIEFTTHAQPERTSRQLRRERERLEAEGKIDLPSPNPGYDHVRPVYRQKEPGRVFVDVVWAKPADTDALVADLAGKETP